MTDQDATKARRAFMHHAMETRRQYDQALDNIAWLTGVMPTWSCGTPVSRSDVHHLLELNRKVAAYCEKHCATALEATTGDRP